MYPRSLDLETHLQKSNLFLFGPRGTGKSSLVRSRLPEAQIFDLLDDDLYEELLLRPKALSEKIKPETRFVVIDEIQKLPKLLDEVHRLIESSEKRFLLTGSSVRKLKRDGANLLGGRARELHLFPLSHSEITDFDLIRYLNYGGLPRIYQSEEPLQDLKAYVRTYLSEEIKAEALVRNYERFVRFLEVAALGNGQELNYAALASDSGVPARTIENHLEVLKDTLLAFTLEPYRSRMSRKGSSRSKLYWFDCGVANFLCKRFHLSEAHSDIGISFEQFIMTEVRSYLSYSRSLSEMSYWRSKSYEVDLIIDREIAIEIKFSKQVKDDHFKGLRAFLKESKVPRGMVVGRFSEASKTEDGIEILPYELFLQRLWAGAILGSLKKS
jgi:predicted AAA+ superfamily ATPase